MLDDVTSELVPCSVEGAGQESCRSPLIARGNLGRGVWGACFACAVFPSAATIALRGPNQALKGWCAACATLHVDIQQAPGSDILLTWRDCV